MKEKPVLSISMLVSGREEMKKSLDSLHFFTEAFPCEIILVDTGCNPEQRALAERYADKIVNFEWCGDFAAARNVGLREARGEWFMYVDDDEWFDNPQEIVNFFVSGEYKQYNCASYVQRNYQDMQGAQYDDSYPSRMIKLGPQTHFEGKIHEFMIPYELPKKEFTDFVHHYGYVYKDDAEKKKHAERNIVPLLEMRKEHPADPRWMIQLAQEYLTLDEYDKVVESCKEGLEEWENAPHDFIYAPSHIGALYAFIVTALELAHRYEEEEEWLAKAFADSHMKMDFMAPNLAFYCLSAAKLYNLLRDYEKSTEYFRRYIDYVKRLKGNRDILEDGAALIVNYVFQDTFMYGIILSCIESVVRVEDHALAEEVFYMMDWQDWRLLNQYDMEERTVEAFCCVAYHPVWQKILQTLVSRPQGMKEMLVVLLETEINCKNQGGDLGRKKLSRLRRLVAGLDYEHRYVLYAKILWADEDPELGDEERRQKITALFEKLSERHQDEILEVKDEIWNVAMRHGISAEKWLVRIEYRRWKQMLEQWCHTAALWEIRQWEQRLGEWRQQSDLLAESSQETSADAAESERFRGQYLLRLNLFAVKCQEGILYHHPETCPSFGDLGRRLLQFADSVLALYRPYYEEFVFEAAPEILPDEAQLALRLEELQRNLEEGNDLKALESMRKCLGICPAVEDAVGAYAKMYRDMLQRRDREASQAQNELNRLIETLKRTARMQIRCGEYEAAKEILIQVQQCAPEDEEVAKLLQDLAE